MLAWHGWAVAFDSPRGDSPVKPENLLVNFAGINGLYRGQCTHAALAGCVLYLQNLKDLHFIHCSM